MANDAFTLGLVGGVIGMLCCIVLLCDYCCPRRPAMAYRGATDALDLDADEARLSKNRRGEQALQSVRTLAQLALTDAAA